MENRNKPYHFLSKSYERSNGQTIALLECHLRKEGYEIIHKKVEDFGPDIKARKGGIIEFYEVETKTDYVFNNAADFPFKTVHFLSRKRK